MIKKTNSLNNEKVKYNLIKKEIGEKSEIVILTRDKFDKKNLIFNGKLCNVYVQNELSRRKKEGNSLNSDIMNKRNLDCRRMNDTLNRVRPCYKHYL